MLQKDRQHVLQALVLKGRLGEVALGAPEGVVLGEDAAAQKVGGHLLAHLADHVVAKVGLDRPFL